LDAVAIVASIVASMCGCTIYDRPLQLPHSDQAAVLLISGGLPQPMADIARHPWFASKLPAETMWTLWEVGGDGTLSDPFDNNRYLNPILHGVWTGDQAAAAIVCLQSYAPKVKHDIEANYLPWPGPNSNTYADILLRRCGLSAGLPSTAIGKDYRGIVGVSWTSEGTGVQLESPVVGVKLGLKEGIEVHILGLSFGIDLWPPALIVPLGPGRLGFADR
jgi:hypothetical protein